MSRKNNALKKRHQNLMKHLLYYFLEKNETKPLYEIKEGITKSQYFCFYDSSVLNNIHFPYAEKEITLEYVLQPFVTLSVYHDYNKHQVDVSRMYDEFCYLFDDFLTKIESEDEDKQIFLKTILITCDTTEKKTCDICVKRKRKFVTCEQCENEVCAECMVTMQKNVLKKINDACGCCKKVAAVKCPFCRHDFPVIAKTEEVFV